MKHCSEKCSDVVKYHKYHLLHVYIHDMSKPVRG